MENIPYVIRHKLRSFRPPQEEPLDICASVIRQLHHILSIKYSGLSIDHVSLSLEAVLFVSFYLKFPS